MSGVDTPDTLIAALAPERAALLSHARALIKAHLPSGFVEDVSGKMIVWRAGEGPDAPMYCALASQKNYAALYLQGAYQSPDAAAQLRSDYAAVGKKLDMGKSCLRFRSVDELHEPAIATALAAFTPEAFRALS